MNQVLIDRWREHQAARAEFLSQDAIRVSLIRVYRQGENFTPQLRVLGSRDGTKAAA